MATAADSSVVKLTINVVDLNSGKVIASTTKNIDALGEAGARAGKQVEAGMRQAGDAAKHAGDQVEAGMSHAGGHTLQAIDKVRLLRDQLGLPITGAMEKIISQSKLAMGAIGAIGGLLAVGGSAMLFIEAGRMAYELYQRVTDVTSAVRQYSQSAAIASAQKLFAASDLETQLANLKQINDEIDKIGRKQTRSDKAGFMGTLSDVGQRYDSQSDGMKGFRWLGGAGQLIRGGTAAYDTWKGKQDQDTTLAGDLKLRSDGQERVVQQQAAEMKRLQDQLSAQASSLTGWAAVEAETQARKLTAALAQKHTAAINQFELDQYSQNVAQLKKSMPGAGTEKLNAAVAGLGPKPVVSPDAGMQQYSDETVAADEAGAARRTVLARNEEKEIAQVRAQANAAGLQGEAVYQAQLEARMDEVNRRFKVKELSKSAYTAERLALQEQYEKEAVARRRQEDQQTRQQEAGAGAAGLTGLARQDAETQTALQGLEADKATFSRTDTYARRKKAIEDQGRAESEKSEQDFHDRLAAMDEARLGQMGGVNQRIDAQTKATTREIMKAWQDLYGMLGPLDQRRVQSLASVQAEIAKNEAAAARQKQIEARKLETDTAKMEADASRALLPRYQQETQAILDDAADRTARLKEQQKQDLDNYGIYARQIEAIDKQKNARMLDADRNLRDQLAGNLRSLFSNPAEFFKQQGEEMASKAAANMLMRSAPGFAQRLAAGSDRGGLFDIPVPGDTHGRGGMLGVRGFNGPMLPGTGSTNATRAEINAPSAMLSVQTATIQVGTANFTGGGGGVSSGAGGSYVPTGNGGFFNVGSSAAGGGSSAGAIDAGSSGPSIPSGPVMGGGQSASDTYSQIYGGAKNSVGMLNEAGAAFGKDGLGDSMVDKAKDKFGISDEAAGKISGVAGGLMGVYSAFQGSGGIGGAASGALSGAQVGMQFGGLIGAGIGAVAGGILGFIGHGARVKAQDYFFKQVQPQMNAGLQGFEAGASDYLTVYSSFDSLDAQARTTTKGFGSGGEDYYNDRIHPAIHAAQDRLTREQKAGRSQLGMTAGQFHNGGIIRDFGSMSTMPGQGWIHAQAGEAVLNQQATMHHADVAMMMNAGASRSDIAGYMGGGDSGGGRMAIAPGATNLNFHSYDAKGAMQLFMDHKHMLRDALDSSYDENSGGSN